LNLCDITPDALDVLRANPTIARASIVLHNATHDFDQVAAHVAAFKHVICRVDLSRFDDAAYSLCYNLDALRELNVACTDVTDAEHFARSIVDLIERHRETLCVFTLTCSVVRRVVSNAYVVSNCLMLPEDDELTFCQTEAILCALARVKCLKVVSITLPGGLSHCDSIKQIVRIHAHHLQNLRFYMSNTSLDDQLPALSSLVKYITRTACVLIAFSLCIHVDDKKWLVKNGTGKAMNAWAHLFADSSIQRLHLFSFRLSKKRTYIYQINQLRRQMRIDTYRFHELLTCTPSTSLKQRHNKHAGLCCTPSVLNMPRVLHSVRDFLGRNASTQDIADLNCYECNV